MRFRLCLSVVLAAVSVFVLPAAVSASELDPGGGGCYGDNGCIIWGTGDLSNCVVIFDQVKCY